MKESLLAHGRLLVEKVNRTQQLNKGELRIRVFRTDGDRGQIHIESISTAHSTRGAIYIRKEKGGGVPQIGKGALLFRHGMIILSEDSVGDSINKDATSYNDAIVDLLYRAE